jgi:hypothetical protein
MVLGTGEVRREENKDLWTLEEDIRYVAINVEV